MNAEALRMMADLGLERRDLVSAPDEIPRRGRDREDPREQAMIAKAFEARRTKSSKDDNGTGDERAARLKAWNTETTFETDEVTGLLENRWSGQGHRAELNRQRLERGDSWETFDARYGEERRLYIQEKGGQPKNYENMKPSHHGRERFRDLLGDGLKTLQSLSGKRHGEKAPPSPQHQNHARAPDPRHFETVKFKPGGTRVATNAAGVQVVSNPGLEAAAALRRSVANAGLAVKTQDRSEPSDPAAANLRAKWSNVDATSKPTSATKENAPPTATSAATQRAKWSNVDAASKPVSVLSATTSTTTNTILQPRLSNVETALKPTSVQPTRTAPNGAAKTTPRTQPPTAPASVVEDWVHVQKCRNLARWHAAKPGEACDMYHAKHPERVRYLEEARKELKKEIVALVKQGDEKEIAAELKLHPEYKWIFDNVRKAKELVEGGEDLEIDAECTNDLSFGSVLRAAKAVFTPQKVPGLFPEDSTDSSRNASDTSDTEDSVQTAASAPPPPGPGSLIATFFDMAGSLLGSHHTKISAPVKATMSFSSRASHFDPRQLIQAIDALAQSMIDRTKGLEGVKMADDGLWVDEEL